MPLAILAEQRPLAIWAGVQVRTAADTDASTIVNRVSSVNIAADAERREQLLTSDRETRLQRRTRRKNEVTPAAGRPYKAAALAQDIIVEQRVDTKIERVTAAGNGVLGLTARKFARFEAGLARQLIGGDRAR